MGAGYCFPRLPVFFAQCGKTAPINYVPTIDGQASPFLDFEQRVMLRNGSTDIPVAKRATLLILVARQVCLHSGGGGM